VTNLRNEPVEISNVVCLHLLPYLDGQHNHADLKRLIKHGMGKKYRLDTNQNGQQMTLSDEQQDELFQHVLDNSLQLLNRAALFIQ
jgi:methyltransferase-like protein